jgi:hypothetical protein
VSDESDLWDSGDGPTVVDLDPGEAEFEAPTPTGGVTDVGRELAAREAARAEGYAVGLAQGRLESYDEGRAHGYALGEADGRDVSFTAYAVILRRALREVGVDVIYHDGIIAAVWRLR